MLEGQVLALTGNALGCPSADLSQKHMGVVLKVLVKKGPIGNTLPESEIQTKKRTYVMAILGTGTSNKYHMSNVMRREQDSVCQNFIEGNQDHASSC